jgi:hypothetical protein
MSVFLARLVHVARRIVFNRVMSRSRDYPFMSPHGRVAAAQNATAVALVGVSSDVALRNGFTARRRDPQGSNLLSEVDPRFCFTGNDAGHRAAQ